MTNGLVLEQGKRVRKLRPSYRSWTKAKERAFLEALSASWFAEDRYAAVPGG
jgi:hypothetical protein